jgi:O-antigen/teichoic acid export membrane protein
MFIGFAAVAEEFVLIFLGHKWEPIVPILIILSFARLLTPMNSLNLNILNARGRSDLFLKTDLSKVPLSLLALFLAIPYGIVGIAIAQLVTTAIAFFINTYYPGKLFKFGAMAQIQQVIPIAIVSLIMYFCISFITFESLEIQMLSKIIVGLSLYTLLCWFFKISAFKDALSIFSNRFKK